MNTMGVGATILFMCGAAVVNGCSSRVEPVDATIALHANDRAASDAVLEGSRRPQVIMVKSERDADVVLLLDVRSTDGPLHWSQEVPLRLLSARASEPILSVTCPHVGADGFCESGMLGRYSNSYLCVDSGRSTVDDLVLDVQVSSGDRCEGHPRTEIELNDVLHVRLNEPATRYLRGGFVARVTFRTPRHVI